jgi:sec-independent protein translocase protein TatA
MLRNPAAALPGSVGVGSPDFNGDAMFEGLLQPTHLLLILAILLVVFGPQKLPQLGKGLGEAIRGFKDAFAGSPTEKKDEDVPKQITK